MCGHIGIIATHHSDDHIRFFSQGLVVDSLRGCDGTGMVVVNEKTGESENLKANMNGMDFVNDKKVEALLAKASYQHPYAALLGHNRFATTNKIEDGDAHPFISGGITLMHNGIIRNADAIAKDYKWSINVDSEVAAMLINKLGYKEALKQIKGAFCLVWHDATDDTINFVRNGERPLYTGISEFGSRMVYGSEDGMLRWLAARNKLMIQPLTFSSLPIGELWKIPIKKINKLEIEKIKVDFAPLVIVPAANNSYPNNSYDKRGSSGRAWRIKEVDDALSVHNLERGSKVEFVPTGFSMYKRQKFFGKLLGTLTSYPYLSVEIHGVSIEDAKEWISETNDPKSGHYPILSSSIITAIKDRFEEDLTLQLDGQIVHAGYAKRSAAALPAPQKKPETVDPVKSYVQGPQGKLIEEKEYLRLVSTGCADCSCDITIADAYKVKWLETGGCFCSACAEKWDKKYEEEKRGSYNVH